MNKKELDKGLSALVLIGFAVIWIIRLCTYMDPVQYLLGKDDTSPVKIEVDAPQQHRCV